ncbi:MAG: DUF2905 domain-containing protein [Chloroflexi bacterium]|nr:DUF2905 domain-containing protein [Chloroflexota bacterium]
MNSLLTIGRLLIILGAALLGVGLVVYLLGRSGISPARLPGNIRIEWGNTTCVVALGLSVCLSVLLTLALNLIARFLNR